MDPTKFWQRVDRTAGPDGCWPWTGCVISTGYGQVAVGGGRRELAHRLAYQLAVGPIPEGLVIDHLCRTPPCCNPSHMEPVTTRINVMRGVGVTAKRARQTACIHGHPLAGDNLYVRPDGSRQCRICARDQKARHRAKVSP